MLVICIHKIPTSFINIIYKIIKIHYVLTLILHQTEMTIFLSKLELKVFCIIIELFYQNYKKVPLNIYFQTQSKAQYIENFFTLKKKKTLIFVVSELLFSYGKGIQF